MIRPGFIALIIRIFSEYKNISIGYLRKNGLCYTSVLILENET